MRLAGILEKSLAGRITCTAVVSVCIAGLVPCVAMGWIASPGSTVLDGDTSCVLLARTDDAGFSAKAAEKDAAPETRKDPEADSKTTAAESEPDNLEKFRPSEEIEADQGVDFPYDI